MAPNFDRDTARALVDAGYMPLKRYIELFGEGDMCQHRPPHAGTRSYRLSEKARRSQRRNVTKAHKAA